MAFRLTFEVLGVPQFDRAFNRVKEHIDDLRPVWAFVQPAFYRIEDAQFKAEGLNSKWAPLTPMYAKRKAKMYPGRPILQASGRMYASVASETSDSTVIKEKDEFGIGSQLPYTMYHQTGTKKMAKRPVVDLTSGQKRDMQKAVQIGLLEILKADPEVRSVIGFE